MNRIQSEHYGEETFETKKISLSCFDNKTNILNKGELLVIGVNYKK